MFVGVCEDEAAAVGRVEDHRLSRMKLVAWVAAAVLPWSAILATGYLLLSAFG